MTSELPAAARCFGLYDDKDIIGFCGITHFPHPTNKKIKKISRLVILPDYQGIGLGMKFAGLCGDMYIKDGYTFSIVTSAKNIIMAMSKSKQWAARRYSRMSASMCKTSTISKKIRDVKTATFEYVGDKGEKNE